MQIVKHWIAYIFNIQQTFVVSYEKDGKKYIRIFQVKNRKNTELNFLVEHLVDNNLEITTETLQKEKKMFFKLPSSK